MTAALAEFAREAIPRHLPKWYARLLGVSVRTGKLYSAQPHLFPRSRAEQLLAHLEEVQSRQEHEIAARRQRLEALRHEISAELAANAAEPLFDVDCVNPELAGKQSGIRRGSVPQAGRQAGAAR